MAILNPSTGGNDAMFVPSEFMFSSETERDNFFITYPSKLKENIVVVVGGMLQKYIDSNWVDISQVVIGPPGNDADELMFEYSVDGSSNWSSTLIPAIHKYWRWSTDGGSTWSADYVRMTGGGDGTSLPSPYEYRAGSNNSLELFKGETKVQRVNDDGTWISTGIYTGTGSLHLGELHSNGSSGENVVWVNSDSDYAYYPNWLYVSRDGTQVGDSTCRTHGVLEVVEPDGSPVDGTAIDANTSITTTSDSVFFYITLVAGETFNGRVNWELIKSTGKTVSQFYLDLDITEGQEFNIVFKYPIWIKSGQTNVSTLKKDDGTFVKVRAASSDLTKPYRKLYKRSFTDHLNYHTGNINFLVNDINSQTGNDRISAGAIRDFPLASKTKSGFVTIGDTLLITQDGRLEIAISPTSVKVVENKPARLDLPLSNGAMIAIQENDGSTWAIEALQDPSVEDNWKQIGTVATKVVSFNDRVGAVKPQHGDYSQDLVITKNDTTSVEGILGFDNNGVYWESDDNTIKIYQTNKTQFDLLSGDVSQISSQINTPVTGILSRLSEVENFEERIGDLEIEVGDLSEQINDPVTGLIKRTDDLYSEIYTSETGILDRVTELEQGGTTTMKFRTHSPSGVYGDGEIVQLSGALYKANSVIDGSVTPVPFVIGLTENTWSPFTSSIGEPLEVAVSDSSSRLVSSGVKAVELQPLASWVPPTATTIADDDGFIHHDTSVNGNKTKKTSMGMLWSWITNKLSGAISSYLTSNATPTKVIVSDANGKLTTSVVSAAELSVIDASTSASSVTLVDADRVVVNDNGTMKQVAMSAVSTYVNSKLPAASGTTTGGYLSTSSSSFQNVTSSQDGLILVDLVYNSGNTQIRLRTSSGTTTAGYWSRINNSSGANTFTFGTSGTTFSIDHYVITIWHNNKSYNLTAAIWQTGTAGHCIVSISQS